VAYNGFRECRTSGIDNGTKACLTKGLQPQEAYLAYVYLGLLEGGGGENCRTNHPLNKQISARKKHYSLVWYMQSNAGQLLGHMPRLR